MSTLSPTDIICQQFEVSCIELFSSMNCDVRIQEGPHTQMGSAPVAYIDAGCEDFEVVIALRVPLSVLTMTYPDFAAESIMEVSEEVLEDWILELANQLIGRFKNKMIPRGCLLKLGLPSMLYQSGGSAVATDCETVFEYLFEVDKEPVLCHLSLQLFNPGVSLDSREEESNNEGELELF